MMDHSPSSKSTVWDGPHQGAGEGRDMRESSRASDIL